ncbi:MAG: hypothetical protein CSA33_08340 [Desulfobulbus propionicus]|nr:MAG: hypothetical protein CSA33_08340 [Desulfobulbus propionicus]
MYQTIPPPPSLLQVYNPDGLKKVDSSENSAPGHHRFRLPELQQSCLAIIWMVSPMDTAQPGSGIKAHLYSPVTIGENLLLPSSIPGLGQRQLLSRPR